MLYSCGVSYRILIADDDLHTRRILETLLAREPALASPEIVGVSDGQAGLAEVEKGRFDLVITDLLMPRLDGFAFARALRQHVNGVGVPLLVTSAIYKDRAALGKLQQETQCEFFAKPFQLRELIRTVLRRLLPGKPSFRALQDWADFTHSYFNRASRNRCVAERSGAH